MQSSREYQIANEIGAINLSGSIGNMLRMQAQRAINEAKIYLWKDEE